MKIVLIICRESLEEDILVLLNEHSVKGYTKIEGVSGSGETGIAGESFFSPGANTIILTALNDDHCRCVVTELKTFQSKLAEQQHGAKIPLRLFVLPCEQLI
jgi:hypothetical protein